LKKLIISLLIFSTLGPKLPVHAESVTSIAISAAQVKATQKAIDTKIDTHSKMRPEDIVSSLEKTFRTNGDRLEKASPQFDRPLYDKLTQDYLTQIRSLGDTESIVAFEKAQAQELSAAVSYNFSLTKMVAAENNRWMDDARAHFINVVCGLFTVPIDLALLPVTIPMSIYFSFPEWNAERKRNAYSRAEERREDAKIKALERDFQHSEKAQKKAEEKERKKEEKALKEMQKASRPSNAN
jgi:hypothetical protein